MLTKTTELATKWLIYLAIKGGGEPLSPRQGAVALRCSPSYLSKTTGLLVKAGILRSTRGTKGGVIFARRLDTITLLEIFEACQGLLTANYCRDLPQPEQTCSFHFAMKELHEATISVLSKWTVHDLIERPARCPDRGIPDCRMFFEGCSDLELVSEGRPAPSRF